jgi:hypothetical protein
MLYATASSNSANSMSALAQQFRAEKPTTGLFGNAQNMFAKLTDMIFSSYMATKSPETSGKAIIAAIEKRIK